MVASLREVRVVRVANDWQTAALETGMCNSCRGRSHGFSCGESMNTNIRPHEPQLPTIGRETLRRNGKVFESAAQRVSVADFQTRSIRFSQLAEQFPDDRVPPLDRRDVDESRLTERQRHWRQHGYVVIPSLVPQPLIDEYLALRKELGLGKAHFRNFTPYVEYEIIRKISLSPELHSILTEVLHQDMGLHFILTAFHSTERGWHQDDYLNPDYVYSNYCAVWISLGDIQPEAGPFEFVPGSHRWPCVRRHLVQQFLSEELSQLTNIEEGKGHWAQYAEVFTNEAYAQQIEENDLPIRQFLARPGDVLIWHGKLVHRGSAPINPMLERPAMISHFSGTTVRSDIGTDIRRYGPHGCFYWHFDK